MSDFQFKATTLAHSERYRRNSRLRLVHRQRSSSHLNSLKEGGSAPRIRMSMVNQPIIDFSSPSVTHISLGPQAKIGDIDFEIQPSLIQWCKLVHLVGNQMRMQTHTFRSFWKCVAPSLSKESQRDPSAVAYSHSLCLGKQINGSTLSQMMLTHGESVL